MEAARLFVTVGADTKSAEGALSSFDQKLKSVAGSMTKTGAAMTLGLTTPLVAAAKSALGMAADYEQSMNVLQVSIGATDKQMAKMSDRAMQLGAETSFSAGEAAEGMLELGKAGMNATQIYDAMPGVLALAAAGQISVAEASAVTASTLNAFGLEAAESTRIADLLAGAANASQANISDLSQGMQQAGFAFKLANQPVEYLAASLALLTDQGLTGSDAGTALKNAFMRMVNPTGEATAVMDKLGISFYDASGNMKQMPDIIGMLNTATEGLTNQQRDAALATIFLSDGMKAIIPLLDAGTEGFNKTVDTVTEVGAATKVSDALMRGLGGGLEYLSGSVETFLLGAALPLTTTLGDWARALGDAITAFGNLPQETQNLALAILAVVAAAGPAILIVGTLAGALSAIGLTAGLAILGVAGLAVAWGMNLGGIRDKTAEVVPAIQEWFAGLSTDVAAVATAISTAFSNTTFPTLDELWADFQAGDAQLVATKIASAAGQLIVNLNTELKFTDNVDALKTKIQSFVTQMTADIASLDFGPVSLDFAAKIDDLAADIKNLNLDGINWVDVLTRILLGPLGAAINTIKWLVTPEQFANLKDAVKTAIATVSWDNLGESFVGLTGAILGQLTKIAQDIIRDFKALFPSEPTTPEPTKQTVDKIVEPVKLETKSFTDISTAFVNKLMADMTASLKAQDWTQIGNLAVLGIVGGIANAFTKSGDFVIGTPAWVAEMQMNFNKTILGIGNNWSKSMGSWLTTTAANLEANFTGLLAAMDTALTNFLTGVRDAALGLVGLNEKKVSAYTNGLNVGSAEVSAFDFSTMFDGMKTSFATGLTNFGTNIGSSISGFFPGIYKSWSEALDTFGADLKGKFSTALQNMIPDWLKDLTGPRPQDGAGAGVGGGRGGYQAQELPFGDSGLFQNASFRTGGQDTQAAPEPLDWAKYVKPLEWMAYIKPLPWQSVVQPLAWQQFIQRMEWQTFVQPITWSQFVQMLNWSGYVARLSWNSFVSALGWNSYVGDLDWGSYIPKLDWGRFVPNLVLPGNAKGTNHWRGGLTWVGEEGPEIVDLPRGSRVFNSDDSMAMAGSTTVNISVASMNNDMDIHSLAMKVAREIARRTR